MSIFDLFGGSSVLLVAVLLLIGFVYLQSRISDLEEQVRSLSPSSPSQKKPEPTIQPVYAYQEEPRSEQVFDQKTEKKHDQEWEQKFGSRAFTIVGGIAVLFGVGFFLRYAFENDLISPPLRVACGVALGLALLGIGGWLSKKFASYGQVLMGLGLGVLYLSSYASLHIYHLVGLLGASFAMIVVTAVGLGLAIYHHSEPLAAFTLLGGFLTPMLLSIGIGYPLFFFIHLFVLDLVVLVFSIARPWPHITIFGLVGTALSFLWWYDRFLAELPWYTTVVFITIFFLLFALAGLVRYMRHSVKKDTYNLLVSGLSPVLYVGALYMLVPSTHAHLEGLWVACIGLSYLGMALMIDSSQTHGRRYRDVLMTIGGALLVVSAPIALDGLTLTMAWSALMIALCVLSSRLHSRMLAGIAQVVGVIVFGNCFALHLDATGGEAILLNARVGTYLFAIAAMVLSAFLHWQKRILEGEYRTAALSVDLLKAYLLAWMLIATEIQGDLSGYWIILCMSIVIAVAGWASCKMGSVVMRYVLYVSCLILAVQCIFPSSRIQDQMPVLNVRVLACGVLLLAVAMLQYFVRHNIGGTVTLAEREKAPRVLFVFSHLLGLWLLNSEIAYIFRTQVEQLGASVEVASQRSSLYAMQRIMQSVGYTFYALGLLSYGIVKKTALARQCAIILFGFVVLKVFLYDSSSLTNYYRFISFLTLGIFLLLSGYFYNRFRDRIRKFVTAS